MTAMDHIMADPRLAIAYRIGSLKMRIDELDNRDTTEAEELELQCYREEISFLEHLLTIMNRG